MGVYRSIVETEEVVHLDDDNNVDLKEIDKIVADHDANADEQERAQDAEFPDPGTEDSVEDIMEESYMAIYEFENENAKIMRAIGLHELNESVAGRDFIFEAEEDKEAFFTRVINKIKAFFKKVIETIDKWYYKIAATVSYNKKLWAKNATQIKAGFEACKGKTEGQPEGYTFDKLPKTSNDVSTKLKAASERSSNFENTSKPEVAVKWTEETANSVIEAYKSCFLGDAEVKDGESFIKALRRVYCGEKKAMWMDINEVKKALSDAEELKNAANTLKRDATIEFKAHIKAINNMKKEAKGDDAKADYIASCTRACNAIQKMIAVTENFRATYLGCVNNYVGQARKYAHLYIKAANAKKEEEKPAPKAESTEFGFLGKFL